VRNLIVLTLIMLSIPLHSRVRVFHEGGWYARVSLKEIGNVKTPVVLSVFNENDTNSAFFLETGIVTDTRLALNDGSYRYRLFDANGKTLDSGDIELKTVFDVSIVSNVPGVVIFKLKSVEGVFIEGFLERDEETVGYRRLYFDGESNLSFDNLESGASYLARFSANGFIRFLRFESPRRNIALNNPVSGTFTRLPESRFVIDDTPAITRINDGNISWQSGMAVSGEVNSSEQFALIDLISVRNFEFVRVIWCANYYPLQYDFIYSVDGKSWKKVSRNGKEYINDIAPDNSPVKIDYFEIKERAKYVGVLVEKGSAIFARQRFRNYVRLMELEIYE